MSTEDTQLDPELNRLYELAFHVVPTEGEDGAEKVFDIIKKILEKKTKVVSESKPALTNLLYAMVKSIDSKNHKHDTAYFSWIKFEADSDVIESINEELEIMDSVLRYMIIKSYKDTNIKTEEVAEFLRGEKEEVKKDDRRREKKEEPKEVKKEEIKEEVDKEVDTEEIKKEVDKEEVDKAIDELVEEK